MKKAPWPDFNGHDIHEGDLILHPSGERGTVVYLAQEREPEDQWRVDYESGDMSRLCLQVGGKGRAIVVWRQRAEAADGSLTAAEIRNQA